jgi:type VI secretion system ImpM family protein
MTPGGTSVSSNTVSVYGKIPSQGDFVRIHASDPVAQALDIWVQESLEALQRTASEFPSDPVYFVFCPPLQNAHTLIGVMLRSSDSVGRMYPLVIFVRVDPVALGGAYSGFPTAYSRFLSDAARLHGELPRTDAALLAQKVRSLRVPSPAEITQAGAVCQHVLTTFFCSDLIVRLFSDASLGKQYYAFKTVLDACDTTRMRPPRTPIVLDCPIGGDVDLFVWLELCRRRLQNTPIRPGFVWCERDTGRLLVTLGYSHGSVVRMLVHPEETPTQLWPLLTTRQDAIELARQGIAPHHRQCLDTPTVSFETLLATLAY